MIPSIPEPANQWEYKTRMYIVDNWKPEEWCASLHCYNIRMLKDHISVTTGVQITIKYGPAAFTSEFEVKEHLDAAFIEALAEIYEFEVKEHSDAAFIEALAEIYDKIKSVNMEPDYRPTELMAEDYYAT